MQKRWFIYVLILVGALAACNAQPTPVLPTLIPTSTDAPAPTDTDVPSPQPTVPTSTAFSLPPTWTFTPVPSNTPVPPTATQAATAQEFTPLNACSTFAIDIQRSVTSFPSNTEPVVAWTAVQGAQLYRVTLYAPDNFGNLQALFDGYTDQTSYTFTRDLYTFEVGTQYGWEVYPIDNLQQQMCLSLGGELAPFTP
ncbi:MAG: hypothetical protein U0694_25470 [Anaerolineae bacterium]